MNRAIDDAERSERLTHREAPADAQEGDASLDGVDISDEWETRDSEHVIVGFYKGLSRRSKPLVSTPPPGWPSVCAAASPASTARSMFSVRCECG